MIRRTAGGESIRLYGFLALNIRARAECAVMAENFGYHYDGSVQDSGFMWLVPDHSPEAQERARLTWRGYPDAGRKGPLPPVSEGQVELMAARLAHAWGARGMDPRKSAVFVPFYLLLWARLFLMWDGSDVAVRCTIGIGALLVVLPLYQARTKRRGERAAAVLEAAGYERITDLKGRAKYVPPGALSAARPTTAATGPAPAPSATPRLP
ncbi:hypothetical protein [Streptomyces mangrovisoli]|uniref:Uncharacterized protein n=1 Tax=Streptomyces mangrovisoli TaxID=1428628 RepID=A0A1J4NY08_9ACTN|nr:hypothetical protein [Streptomyces mangrovisoli]OIJ67367.1 hypothetical protein WN71_013425 [Streptomyces mangrovisoli]